MACRANVHTRAQVFTFCRPTVANLTGILPNSYLQVKYIILHSVAMSCTGNLFIRVRVPQDKIPLYSFTPSNVVHISF